MRFTLRKLTDAQRAARLRYQRAYRAAHREQINAYQRDHYAKQPRTERVKAKARASARRALGIISPSGETREGVCPVCLRTFQLDMDHDHGTGRMRGWICRRCNLGLGQIGDTLAAARRLVAYLEVPL
jgi:hypothetical protein